jgi:excisionase family DNA binding protein
MSQTPPEIMTLGEVAAYLRAHPSTVYRLIKTGAIPGWRLGADWRFTRKSIERWVEARQNGTDKNAE